MRPIRFLSPAEREMRASARYYESCSPNLGHRFLKDVQHAIEAIVVHPFAGAIVRGEMRRRLLHRFPFAVLYSVDPEEIVVVAVMDLRREPEYWISRV